MVQHGALTHAVHLILDSHARIPVQRRGPGSHSLCLTLPKQLIQLCVAPQPNGVSIVLTKGPDLRRASDIRLQLPIGSKAALYYFIVM